MKSMQKTNSKTNSKTKTQKIFIAVSILFLSVMLLLPMATVLFYAFKEGIGSYLQAITEPYALKALLLTIEATCIAVVINTIFGVFAAFCVTKYDFFGKHFLMTLMDLPFAISPVIAGLCFVLTFGRTGIIYPILHFFGVKFMFTVTGIVFATIFVTFPYVSREMIPVLQMQGREEEEAAGLMGAKGFTIFRKITFPHIKWAFLYGVVLCSARAMGEFGAVSVISGHLKGKTNTLPLQVEILYNDFQLTSAMAVSSLLVVLAIVILVVKNMFAEKNK